MSKLAKQFLDLADFVESLKTALGDQGLEIIESLQSGRLTLPSHGDLEVAGYLLDSHYKKQFGSE